MLLRLEGLSYGLVGAETHVGSAFWPCRLAHAPRSARPTMLLRLEGLSYGLVGA
jgi:hypothetical protein